jgi:NADH-quinone oxidoreductase subunit K
MTPIPFEQILLLGTVLFVVGLAGVLARRNLILILLSIEIMLNAAGLIFIAGGSKFHEPDGQVMFLFILAVAASEVTIGLALILAQNHASRTLDADAADQLRDR